MELVARVRREAAAGRDRAAPDRRRGAGAARREGLRRLGAALASRLRPRPRRPGRRGDRRHPDPAEDPRRLRRGRGPRRDPARGRQQRDRRRRGGDRADGAGPPRRGDDRQRRADRGRHLRQRRPRPLRDPRRGAQPRRRRARPRSPGRSPTPAPGARASTAATSTCGSKSSSAATSCRRPRRRWAWPRRACAAPGSSRRGSRSAAAATPTSSASTASTASCSPTAPTRSTPPTSTSPAAQPRQDARGLRGHPRRGRASGRGVSGRLELRRGVVVSAEPLVVEIDGERRPAWADEVLLGEMREGDEVVVNVAALDLGLGSGGFDVVHVNLTRGLEGGGAAGDEHVIKLNYTSLQHPVEPVEAEAGGRAERLRVAGASGPPRGAPVLVLPLHGHLAPAAWAAAQARPGIQVGYVQTGGGALPGSLSRDVAELRERGLLCGHITAGARLRRRARGAQHGRRPRRRRDRARLGRGPGRPRPRDHRLRHRVRPRRHGRPRQRPRGPLPGAADPDLSPRLSSGDPRERHRDLSHHTATVLELLLAPVDVAVPEGDRRDRRIASRSRPRRRPPPPAARAPSTSTPTPPPASRPRTMGRSLAEDPLFFAAPLAGGHASWPTVLSARSLAALEGCRARQGRTSPLMAIAVKPAVPAAPAGSGRRRPLPSASSSTSSPTWSWSAASRATR